MYILSRRRRRRLRADVRSRRRVAGAGARRDDDAHDAGPFEPRLLEDIERHVFLRLLCAAR